MSETLYSTSRRARVVAVVKMDPMLNGIGPVQRLVDLLLVVSAICLECFIVLSSVYLSGIGVLWPSIYEWILRVPIDLCTQVILTHLKGRGFHGVRYPHWPRPSNHQQFISLSRRSLPKSD